MKKSRKLFLSTSLVFMGLLMNVSEGRCSSYNFQISQENELTFHKISQKILSKLKSSKISAETLGNNSIVSKFINFMHHGNFYSCNQLYEIKIKKNNSSFIQKDDQLIRDWNISLTSLSAKKKTLERSNSWENLAPKISPSQILEARISLQELPQWVQDMNNNIDLKFRGKTTQEKTQIIGKSYSDGGCNRD